MKKILVHMLAFDPEERFREVYLPDHTPDDPEEVFAYGQNEFAIGPKQLMPSVSVGDVVFLERNQETTYHLAVSVGFKQLSQEQYDDYLKLPRIDRIFSSLLDFNRNE